MADALVTQLARALNLSPDAARHTLTHLVATLREQIEASGAASVPGLGTFSWEADRLVFAPEDALARAVNHRYAGLKPITAGPAPAPPEDPFAAEAPSAADSETRAEAEPEPAPPAEFQPIEAFIEPEEAKPDGGEPAPNVEEWKSEGTGPAEAVPVPDDELAEHERSFSEEEPSSVEDETALEEEPAAQEDVTALDKLDAQEKAEINTLLADISTSDPETSGDEDAFEPVLDDSVEAAGPSLEEPEPELQPEPELEGDGPAFEDDFLAAAEDESFGEEEYWNEEEDLDDEEDEEVVQAEAPPAAVAPDPPPVSEPVPEPTSTPAAAPTMAPAVAATAAAATVAARDRRPAEPSPGNNFRLLAGAGTVLLLAILALLWFLNREPAGPTVTERSPVAEDTVAAMPPPLDTLSAGVPTDTAAVATPTPEPETPAELTPPEPSSDPLRSTAGIDAAAGGWTWVVASEFDRATAERRVAQYRDQGLRADVIAGDAGGRTRYRVGLGQFATTDEANRYRSNLPAGVPEGTWLLQL